MARMAESQGGVTIVVPTLNEAGNLRELYERLSALDLPDMRLLLVDDGSQDGTEEAALSLGANVSVIQRGRKLGLGTAYVDGFKRVLEGDAKYVVQMDADLSHSPEYLPAFLEALGSADVVVGSRYVQGGGVDERWGRHRQMLSAYANLGIRLAAGLKVRDATSGFKAYRRETLAALDLDGLRCNGFAFQAEVAHACQRMGARVVEHPIVFMERVEGKSKMSSSIMIEALWKLPPLRFRRRGKRD